MSAHDKLERQLRASVAHNADRRPALRLRVQSWSRGVSALIVAMSTAVALGVAVVALVALHHGHPPSSGPALPATAHHGHRLGSPPPPLGPIPRNVDDNVVANAYNAAAKQDPACGPGSASSRGLAVNGGTPSAAVLSTLPVLRRPATSVDRLPGRLYSRGRLLAGPSGEVYVHYIRRVRVAYGRTFYLAPAANLGRSPLSPSAADRCYRLLVAALRSKLATVPRAERAATLRYGDSGFADARYYLETSSLYEGVFLFDEFANGGGGGNGGQSLSSIQHGGPLGGGGGGFPPTPIVMDGIVPSGVATVTLTFPATRHGTKRLPPLNATGDVVNNVFVITIPTLFQRGGWPATAIWRSASGHIVKTINEERFHP